MRACNLNSLENQIIWKFFCLLSVLLCLFYLFSCAFFFVLDAGQQVRQRSSFRIEDMELVQRIFTKNFTHAVSLMCFGPPALSPLPFSSELTVICCNFSCKLWQSTFCKWLLKVLRVLSFVAGCVWISMVTRTHIYM